mmetsp:Transcript_11498/g.10165  ORF Transcript_11498/g.10165 Transcript_11498/m.10165 type:complete len:206 (-) Transcript_11498:87-704(-)
MKALTLKLKQLNEEAKEVSLLKTIEEKTGVQAIYFIFGAVGVILLFVFSGYFAQFLANATGFVYPAYKSIKSLESPGLDDDKQWLTYWTVYGIFVIFDDWSGFITGYIPQYFLIKMIFLIWLFAPTTKGAVLLYNTLVKDLFSKYSKSLDKIITKIVGESKQLVDEIKTKATDPGNIGKVIDAASKFDDVLKKRDTGDISPAKEE